MLIDVLVQRVVAFLLVKINLPHLMAGESRRLLLAILVQKVVLRVIGWGRARLSVDK